MNVFLRELRTYLKSALIWTGSLSAIVVLFMAMYPAFSKDVEGLTKVLENFPEAVRAALNMSTESFFSVFGFYAYLLSFAILTAAIQAMNIGVGVISREFAGKTADFLLSKPVRRWHVVTAKLGAALLAVLFTNVVFSAVSFIAVSAASEKDFDAGTLFLLASTMLLVQLIFLALGALFSVVLPKVKSVVAVSLPTVFAFYIIGTIGDVLENEQFRWISPFRYYDPLYIIKNKSFETEFLVLEAAVVVVAIVATYVIFIKKDIRAAA